MTSREYLITWTSFAGEVMEELFDDDAAAMLRRADLQQQHASDLSTQSRPVGDWEPDAFRYISVSRERGNSALLRAATDEERDWIRGCAVMLQDSPTEMRFKVDAESRIVKLLYPELINATPSSSGRGTR